MKSTKYLLLLMVVFSSCSEKKNSDDMSQMYLPYKVINLFSRKIKPETELELISYGINLNTPKGYQYKNGVADFKAGFYLNKKMSDVVSLEDARKLIVFLSDGFLSDINSNLELRPLLEEFPFGSSSIQMTIHFKDENRVDLGQGVAIVYFYNGKITYEGYEIEKYTGSYPAEGKHFVIHEETYEEALEIVKKQGGVTYLN